MGYDIRFKRIYDPATEADGARVLVDRLWRRGKRKDELKLCRWYKDAASSSELRRAWHQGDIDTDIFSRDYEQELMNNTQALIPLMRDARAGRLILLICLMAVAFWLSSVVVFGSAVLPGTARLMHSSIIGLLLLMSFMGGRIIAPAAAGALSVGIALLTGTSPIPALHLITTGALGVLSASVMLRVAWQRSARTFPGPVEIIPIAVLLSGAAIIRYLAGASPFNAPVLLWCSAALWSTAYL